MANEAIENLMFYKYIILNVTPFELNLDGNFCDETYKYLYDVFNVAAKFTSRSSRQQKLTEDTCALLNGENNADGYDPTAIKSTVIKTGQLSSDMEQMKKAFNDQFSGGNDSSQKAGDQQPIVL